MVSTLLFLAEAGRGVRGNDNYPVDRGAVREILRLYPEVRPIALANQAFLQRAVRFLAAGAGVRQFLDIGTGIPSAGNVHEVAGQVAPDARVVHVDNDPMMRQLGSVFGNLS